MKNLSYYSVMDFKFFKLEMILYDFPGKLHFHSFLPFVLGFDNNDTV